MPLFLDLISTRGYAMRRRLGSCPLRGAHVVITVEFQRQHVELRLELAFLKEKRQSIALRLSILIYLYAACTLI